MVNLYYVVFGIAIGIATAGGSRVLGSCGRVRLCMYVCTAFERLQFQLRRGLERNRIRYDSD